MKQTIKAFILAIAAAMLAVPASAQFIGYTSPQGVIATPFTGVTTPQTSLPIINEGQTVHFLTYTNAAAGTFGIQLRLEGSYDNATYIPISDDGTDSGGGEILAVGYYPYVRANLVACSGCSGGGLTVRYSGISSSPSNPFGTYNPSQQIRKVMFVRASDGTSASSAIVAAPYGSTAGALIVNHPTGGFPGGSLFGIGAALGDVAPATILSLLPPVPFSITPMPATAATSVQLFYTSGGAQVGTFSAYYIFYPPGSALPAAAQPATTANTQSTSGTNAAVTTAVTPQGGIGRAHLFSVSARCSAGSAGITVQDNVTTIYSTAATQVGTTNFDKTWTVGLASSPSNALQVTLSTCGAGNTGILDVQGSIF
jgi:hypothetical protein